MGKHKYIKDPDEMWQHFQAYKKEVEDNPFLIPDWVGKDANKVKRERMRTLTMEGFECYVMEHTRISYPDLTEYFENKNESYSDFNAIGLRIRREIRKDQLDKGLANISNPNITQRMNNLVDRQSIEPVEKNLPNWMEDESES